MNRKKQTPPTPTPAETRGAWKPAPCLSRLLAPGLSPEGAARILAEEGLALHEEYAALVSLARSVKAYRRAVQEQASWVELAEEAHMLLALARVERGSKTVTV